MPPSPAPEEGQGGDSRRHSARLGCPGAGIAHRFDNLAHGFDHELRLVLMNVVTAQLGNAVAGIGHECDQIFLKFEHDLFHLIRRPSWKGIRERNAVLEDDQRHRAQRGVRLRLANQRARLGSSSSGADQ